MTDPLLPPRDAPADGPEDPNREVADEPVGGAVETPADATGQEAAASKEGGANAENAAPPQEEAPSAPSAAAGPPRPRDLTVAATLVAFAIGCVLVIVGYVAINGGVFRTSATARTYEATRMNVPRGTGRIDGGVLSAQGVGSDVLIIAVTTDFRARDLATVAWDVSGLPDDADVRLLFNSDYTPRRVHNRPMVVESGRLQPIALTDDRDWLGRITGLALAVRAPGATVRVRNVVAKPLSLGQLLSDRGAEWLRDEPWTGTSINGVTGGAAMQSLPLPLPLTVAALLAFAILVGVRRLFPARLGHQVASIAALAFLVARLVLDVRWTANLVRQVATTFERYGSRDAGERALAAEDGELAAFVAKAKALMPGEPQRVVVLAEAHYFRGRAAWHMLPHRVQWEPARDAAPVPGQLRPGDFLLVWRRPGTQLDAAKGSVRFDNGVVLGAAVLLLERGSALVAIR